MTPEVLAVCAACSALAAGAEAADLTPLMDEHTKKTGHRFWAVSTRDLEDR